MAKRARKKKVLVDRELLRNLSQISLPTSIFRESALSVLEAIVVHLKEQQQLTYRQIGIVLGRDERNIWTVYNRTKQKREKNQ